MTFKIILLRFLALYIYILVFGAIMWAVEKTTNDEQQETKKNNNMEKLWKTMNSKYNMTRQEFVNFTNIAHEALTPATHIWNYHKGLHFAMSVCTTIGYGEFTPTTDTGKILCVFGALIGIPLTLLTLNLMGSIMNNGFLKLIRTVESRLLHRSSIKNIELKCLACSVVAMLLTFLAGTLLIVNITSWSYLNTVYYQFITFSTIGFGDYMLIRENVLVDVNITAKIIIRSAVLVYTLFGLAVVACVINSAVEVTQSLKCGNAHVNDANKSRSCENDVIVKEGAHIK